MAFYVLLRITTVIWLTTTLLHSCYLKQRYNFINFGDTEESLNIFECLTQYISGSNIGCMLIPYAYHTLFAVCVEVSVLSLNIDSHILFAENECPDPGRPDNGDRFGDFKVGSTVRFSCQYGFVLRGSRERTCMENLEWSGHLTTCQDGSKRLPNGLSGGCPL